MNAEILFEANVEEPTKFEFDGEQIEVFGNVIITLTDSGIASEPKAHEAETL